MASSGTISCRVKSVDYGGTRGHVTMDSYFAWALDSNSNLTITYLSSSSISGDAHTWGICTSSAGSGYAIFGKAQFSTDGGATWVDIMSSTGKAVAYCYPSTCASCPDTCRIKPDQTVTCTTNVYDQMSYCFQQFQPVHLTQSGLLRIAYGANRDPAPSATLPYSFPSWVTTGQDQVDIIPIELDYRPGEVRINDEWKSCNRDGGKCDKRENGAWVEMKTIEGSGDPPSVRESGAWRNQSKIGSA